MQINMEVFGSVRSSRNANLRLFVCSSVCPVKSVPDLSRNHLSLSGQSWVSLRSVSGQSQVSLRSVSGQSQVGLRSVSGQSQVSLRSVSG